MHAPIKVLPAFIVTSLMITSSALAEGCATTLSDNEFQEIITAYWRPTKATVPMGLFEWRADGNLGQLEPVAQKVNRRNLIIMAGAVAAGWAWSTIDGVSVDASTAGAQFVRVIADGERHEIKFGATDLGRHLSDKTGTPVGFFTPNLGDTGNYQVLDNQLQVLGSRVFRAIKTDYDIVNRPPNLEAYGRAQLAVVSALENRAIVASPTTSTTEKKATFLLLQDQSCHWQVLTVDVADRGRSYATQRVPRLLTCISANPDASIGSCESPN
jgi:hypothetical protein